MSEEGQIRSMNKTERRFIQLLMDEDPLLSQSTTKAIFQNLLVVSAVYTLMFGLLIATAFVGFYLTNTPVKTDSLTYGYPVLVALFASVIYITISDAKCSIKKRKLVQKIYKDELASGQVNQLSFTLSEVKIAQGKARHEVANFLRLTDGRIFVLYDQRNSKDRPLQNHFTIRRQCTLVRSMIVKWMLNVQFQGEQLTIGHPFQLPDNFDRWPDEGFIDIPWHDIEKRFAR